KMKTRLFTTGLSASALVLTMACGPKEPTVEKKTESTTQTSQGEAKTTTETKQVGTDVQSTTTTKADTPEGTVKGKTETYIGTVTTYTAGKKIVVTTGEKKTESFDLDAKDTVATVDPKVAVGSRVKLVDEKNDAGQHKITVTPES